jgi:GNAT superfamily N-acetyltransferase
MKIQEYTDDSLQAYLIVYIVGYYYSLYRNWLLWLKQVEPPQYNCLMAYEENNPVGLIVYKESKDLIDINDLVVLPEYRKKGMARALVSQVENIAKEKGISVITAAIFYGEFEGDPRLQELFQIYASLGFDQDGIGAWVYTRNIPEGFVKIREQGDDRIYISERDLQKLKEANISVEIINKNYDLIKRIR